MSYPPRTSSHKKGPSVSHAYSHRRGQQSVSDLLPNSPVPLRSWSNTLFQWPLTRIQKIALSILIVATTYIGFSATRPAHPHHLRVLSPAVIPGATPTLLRNVQPPPTLPSRVKEAASAKPFEKDPDDLNPTMRKGATKALVIASYEYQDLDWLDDLGNVSAGWEVYRYIPEKPKDDPLAPNLGREASAYLQYIVDNYNNLSDYMIFNHGHDRSWHQPMRMLDKIVAMNWTAVDQEHYINLRCDEAEGCTNSTKYYFDEGPGPDDRRWGYHIEKFWNTSMRPQIGPMPRVIGRRCCAQFAVDKTAIHHRPQIFYQRLLDPLIAKNLTELQQYWGDNLPFDRFATLFEMTWHIIFGKKADHCPSSDYCNKVHFQNIIHCDREVNEYKYSEGWENITCTNDLLPKSMQTSLGSAVPAAAKAPAGAPAAKPAVVDGAASARPAIIDGAPAAKPPVVNSAPAAKPPVVDGALAAKPAVGDGAPAAKPPVVDGDRAANPLVVDGAPVVDDAPTFDASAVDGVPAAEPPAVFPPAADAPAADAPAADAPAADAPAADAPAAKAPAGKAPAADAPAAKAPAGKAPAADAPADDAPAADAPVIDDAEAPVVDGASAANTPAVDAVAANAQAVKDRVGHAPADDLPAVKPPVVNPLADNYPAVHPPVANAPAADVPAAG